jgi:hypothetical protein
MTEDCLCQKRLCDRCVEDHRKKNKKSEIMQINNYYNKLDMETDIVSKQYQFIK